MTALDAGCGPGRVTEPLARNVGTNGRVVALDIQPGMLARAKGKVGAAGHRNVDFLSAALGSGALPTNCFDRAVLVTVLGEVPDRAAALAELFGALKPGGVLAIVELIFDPHFQPRRTVTSLDCRASTPGGEFTLKASGSIAVEEEPGDDEDDGPDDDDDSTQA